MAQGVRVDQIYTNHPRKQVLQDETLVYNNLLTEAAHEIRDPNVSYVSSYVAIDYPMGDVDPNTGVCSDVIIRAYRKLNIDLQQLVHEDMKENFDKYPSYDNWGMTKPDKNIDHRRVYNLMAFFARQQASLPIEGEYIPGDILVFKIFGRIPHIGIYLGNGVIMHNIGGGQVYDSMHQPSYEMYARYRWRVDG
jgi:uncharacterized protein YijF (DUF1287 family)